MSAYRQDACRYLLRIGLAVIPLGVWMHLGNYVLQEEKRAVVDGRQTGTKAAREARGLLLALYGMFLVLPLVSTYYI